MSEIGSGGPESQAIGEEALPMASQIGGRPLAHVAGAIGIVAQLASAYWYVLYPLLVIPSPASYAFFVAWFILVGLTIIWWRHHPIRSFFVPIVSIPVARHRHLDRHDALGLGALSALSNRGVPRSS